MRFASALHPIWLVFRRTSMFGDSRCDRRQVFRLSCSMPKRVASFDTRKPSGVGILVGVVLWIHVAQAMAQDASRQASRTTRATRWDFVAIPEPLVQTRTVRIGDLIKPMDPQLAAWPRISQQLVALIPESQRSALVSRDRLATWIESMEATASRVAIHSEEVLPVYYRNPQASKHHVDKVIVGASYTDPFPADDESAYAESQSESVDPAFAERLEREVTARLNNQFPALVRSFETQVIVRAADVGTLENMRGIAALEPLREIPEWVPLVSEQDEVTTIPIRVRGRSPIAVCEGIVQLRLRSRVGTLAAARNLPRGKRISRDDLTWIPVDPRSELEAFTDLESVIGLESRIALRAGVRVSASDFQTPQIIQRGDLVEIQVTGGGFRVTTAAKALGDAAEGDLMEVETIQPRRRLMARAIGHGLVEIITQPQRTLR
ncbi:MAG: flagellar basal body P-ring formation chaperone FlgA [Planctomycetota bacterium]